MEANRKPLILVRGKRDDRTCELTDSRILSMFDGQIAKVYETFEFIKKVSKPQDKIKVRLGNHQFKVGIADCALAYF